MSFDKDPKDDEGFFSIRNYLSNLFVFLTTPESYLLSAGLLSSLPALLFVSLNILALNCVLTQCPALEDGSNTLSSWLIFEGITTFFVATSSLSFVAYFRIRRRQKGLDKGK